jgi:hypothetical protein
VKKTESFKRVGRELPFREHLSAEDEESLLFRSRYQTTVGEDIPGWKMLSDLCIVAL